MVRILSTFLLAALAAPVFAWDPVGHRVIAAMAYDMLSKPARARVDELIRKHPDYERFREGVTGNPARVARWAFIHAAAWPDDIKGDDRFWDDTRRGATATAPLAPFPDTKRHANWHYVNLYFSPDSTTFPSSPTPNALTQLPVMIEGLAGEQGWYYLPWLLHVEGDIHQPMHCVSRFTKHLRDRDGKPASDLGGNQVNVDGYTNLHAVWDELLGSTLDETYIGWKAKRLRKEHRKPASLSLDPKVWVDEGFEWAKKQAYQDMPADTGTRAKPFRPTRKYRLDAVRVARERAAIGAYRLAAVINQKLR